MRKMYDSIDLKQVPKDGDMVAYYLNGKYAVPTITYVEKLFDPMRYSLVPIDVIGNRADYARVADVETGDIRPEFTEQWISDFNASNPSYEHGGRPEIYCNRNTIAAVRVGTGRYLLGRDYYLWVATGDGTIYRGENLTGPYAKNGVNACQAYWHKGYDESVVFSDQWMPTPKC